MPGLFLPTDEFVARALLSEVLGVPAATTLPKLEQWPTFSGSIRAFGTVTVVGGGAPDTLMQDPVISVGTWASVPGSDNPQWGAANQLASLVWRATQTEFVPRTYRQSNAYMPALVQSVSPVARPRRVADPDASVAHYETEIRLHWTEVG